MQAIASNDFQPRGYLKLALGAKGMQGNQYASAAAFQIQHVFN
jgi:hypothetical protein